MRLAIILASLQRREALRSAMALARFLAGRSWPGAGRTAVTLGLPEEDGLDSPELRAWGRAHAVALRGFTWRPVDAGAMREILHPSLVPAGDSPVLLPDDAGREFRDCDAWIFVASYAHARIPWMRPTAVFCGDLAPRRVSAAGSGPKGPGDRSLLAEAMTGWRRAHCAFANDPTTAEDLVSYAGIPPDRVVLVPPLLADPAAPEEEAAPVGAQPGLLWLAEDDPRHDLAGAVAALRRYVALGGTLGITVRGRGSLAFDPARGGDHPVARALAEAPELLERLRFVGDPPAGLRRAAAAHGIVWHVGAGEAAGFAAHDAAEAGAWFVAPDGPALRRLCGDHGVDALLYGPGEAARALLDAEARLRAGTAPRHAPRRPDEAALDAAYRTILGRLAGPATHG